MKQENSESTINVAELTQKMEKMEEILNKDIFNNPIRQVQEKMREELLDFSKTFHSNLKDMQAYIVKILKINKILIYSHKTELESNQAAKKVSGPGVPDEEQTVPKRLLEKKEYQCEIIKQAFTDYEKKTVNF